MIMIEKVQNLEIRKKIIDLSDEKQDKILSK